MNTLKNCQNGHLAAEARRAQTHAPHFCRYLSCTRAREADFIDILREHSHFWDIWLNWEANFVAILREHAHFGNFLAKSGSRFRRYFA